MAHRPLSAFHTRPAVLIALLALGPYLPANTRAADALPLACDQPLTLDRPLDVDIDIQGAKVTMYMGKLGQHPVTVTRWNDGWWVTTPGDAGPSSICLGMPDARLPASVARQRRSADGRKVLSFHILLHDDLIDGVPGHAVGDRVRPQLRPPRSAQSPEHAIESVHSGYVAWWLADLATNVLPDTAIRISYRTRLAGLTDGDYTQEEFLGNWYTALGRHALGHGLPWGGRWHKFLLVVPDMDVTGFSGRAFVGGVAAVASLSGRYSVIAHELGHTLDASHEQGRVQGASTWWCQTNMYPTPNPLLGNCYEYSAANQLRIRQYVQGGDDHYFPPIPAMVSD